MLRKEQGCSLVVQLELTVRFVSLGSSHINELKMIVRHVFKAAVVDISVLIYFLLCILPTLIKVVKQQICFSLTHAHLFSQAPERLLRNVCPCGFYSI